MLKQAVSRTQANEWYKRFKEGRTSVEDKCSGRRSVSKNYENVQNIWEVFCLTVYEVAEEAGF
jgi:hypothetical protein